MAVFTEKEILDDIASYNDNGWDGIKNSYYANISNAIPFCLESCIEFVNTCAFAVEPDDVTRDMLNYTGHDYSEDYDAGFQKYKELVGERIFYMLSLDKEIDKASKIIPEETVNYYLDYRAQKNNNNDLKQDLAVMMSRHNASSEQIRSALRSKEIRQAAVKNHAR